MSCHESLAIDPVHSFGHEDVFALRAFHITQPLDPFSL